MMSEEAIKYNKFEVQSLLKISTTSEFKLERIFSMYKKHGADHFFYNVLRKINLPDKILKSKYVNYETMPGDVWTLISYKFYNRIDLWWLIAMFNRIDDTFSTIESGTLLIIPTPEYVREVLNSIKNQI